MVNRFLAILASVFLAFGICTNAEPLHSQVFDNSFRTIEISPLSNSYLPPIWVMGQDDNPLVVSFDNLSEDRKYLRYSLVHCNSDWTPSQLQESEYTNSFNYADIENYEYSSNTFAHYVHYSFTLPNENMQLLRSGNYIVKVYEQDNPDEILFQTRFSVCENIAMVKSSVSSRTDIDYNERHQQIEVEVIDHNHSVNDPFNDLTLIVSQNTRLDNEVTIKRPLLVSGNRYTFSHNSQLIFPAGNEYRRIETVAINAPSMGVMNMQFYEPYYHAILRTDNPRADQPYYYDKTQNGHFTIRNWESEHSDIEADYVVTHFSLDTDGPLTGGDIYIDGEFAEHLSENSRKMVYDASSGLYTADILLKQGAYNYQYLWLPDGVSVGSTSLIEGDKYQTVNEYLVKLYQRRPGDRYDRFIGFGITFSGK